ncbi:MAG: polyketide synthase dehydratase domain-containing protein, partial [Pseudonocardiaceae bacterium]
APRQSIICGPPGVVDELVATFRRRGVVAQVLPFRSGFHTPMLAPYLDPIRAIFRRIALQAPRVPMWSATTASEYPQGRPAVCELVIRHLLAPVRFRSLIEAMHAAGFAAFVQLGCGQLGSLISDTLRGTEHLVIAATSPQHQGLAQLHRVATALWTYGLGIYGSAVARPDRRTVRLDLSAALVSLPAAHRPPLVRREGIGAELAGRGGIAGELAETLRETVDAAVTVLAAGQHGAAQAGPRVADGPSASSVPGEFTGVLRVCTEAMPYLHDHCLFAQRPDRSDGSDRIPVVPYPVVPATTLVAQLADVAEQVLPGAIVIAVRDIRLNRWLPASPPIDVRISAIPVGQGVLAMSVGQYATATVELAADYPVPTPAVWSFDPANERVPTLTAAGLYRERWPGHGPAFQGVTELSAIGKTHVRGVLTTPAAPGGLLDSAGQLLDYWIKTTHRKGTPVFPAGMRAIRFFGPHPTLGARLTCSIRITALDDTTLEADMQLVASGQVWAQIAGWVVKENEGREWSV